MSDKVVKIEKVVIDIANQKLELSKEQAEKLKDRSPFIPVPQPYPVPWRPWKIYPDPYWDPTIYWTSTNPMLDGVSICLSCK